MNSIASFLPNLLTRPSTDPQDSRNDSEDGINSGKGTGGGFDTVLSGLSQNASADTGKLPVSSSPMRFPGDLPAGGPGAAEPAATAPASDAATTLAQQSAKSAAAAGASAQATRTSVSGGALSGSPLPSVAAGAPPISGRGIQSPPVMLSDSTAVAPNLLPPGGFVAAPQAEQASGASIAVSGQQRGAIGGMLVSGFGANQQAGPTAGGGSDGSGDASSAAAAATLRSVSQMTRANAALVAVPVAIPMPIAMVATPAGGSSASKGASVDAQGSAASRDAAKTSDASTLVVPIDPTALAALAAMVVPNRSAAESAATAASKDRIGALSAAVGGGAPAVPQSGDVLQLRAQLRMQAVTAAPGLNGNPIAADSAPQSFVTGVEPRSLGDAAAMKVVVLSSATYFAPVARLSPVQQIADAVLGALPPLSQGAAAPVASSVANVSSVSSVPNPTLVVAQPAATAIKTMNLQLDPGSLGVVTITLSLSANGLNVQMAANQVATMNIIEKDKQSLSDQLGQSGYSVAGLAVTLDAHSGANVPNNGSATQSQGGQGSPASGNGQAASQGGSSNGNNSGQQASDRGSARQNAPGHLQNGVAGSTSRGSVSGDLYI